MKALPVSLALAFTLALAACAGDDGGAPTPSSDAGSTTDARDPTLLWVAGFYPTTVTLMQSTCQGIQVASMSTTVTHTAGSPELLLRHASVTYTALIELDGTFSTYPQSVGPPAETHRLIVAGRFSTTGFEATVSVEVFANGIPSCTYSVSWVGTKNGEPNVVPG